MPVTSWSTSPSSNNAAPPDGWPEGMAAAAVNNTARQMMADLVIEFQRNPVKVLGTVAGTNTITAVMTPTLTAYSNGMSVLFTPANNTTGAATININGLGAKSIVKGDGTALETGDLQASTIHFLIYDGTNFVCLNPLSLNLVNGTFSGTLAVTGALTLNGVLTTDNSTADEVGFKGIPQNSQSGSSYTLVLTDASKHVVCAGSSMTITIPANASVAFPIGTVVTFIGNGSGSTNTTIAITTDTLFLAGTAFATTGSRTLAYGGLATALKTGATAWMISGTGLS
jgi:hypothetical protein